MRVADVLARRSPRRKSATGSGPVGGAHRVGPARDSSSVACDAGDHDACGPEVRSTSPSPATPVTGSVSTREPARTRRAAAQRLERVGVELVARGVADQDRRRAQRRRREPVRAHEPVGGPARGERPGRAVEAVARGDLAQRGQQHLLDGALDRAQRERGLHRAVGAVELEGRQRADEDAACRPSASRARGRSPRRSTGPLAARRAARRSRRACRGGACPPCAAARDSRSGAPTRAACSGSR